LIWWVGRDYNLTNSLKNNTAIYLSLSKEDDDFIDKHRLDKCRRDSRHYTKTEICKELILLGLEVYNGKYLKLDPNIDSFVSQLQDMTVEMNGNKITIKKSKEQVYHMLIEKGLQHLSEHE
jgi:hypothetical protein